MARYAGLVRLPDGLVVHPDVSGGALAGGGLDFVVHDVPVVFLEDDAESLGVLVDGPRVQQPTGRQLHGSLGWHFLQL